MLSTFIQLPWVIKIIVLLSFEWLFYTCFTVFMLCYVMCCVGITEQKKDNSIKSVGQLVSHVHPSICPSVPPPTRMSAVSKGYQKTTKWPLARTEL